MGERKVLLRKIIVYIIDHKMIFDIPPEIWDEILNFLSPEDLIKIAQISSYLAEIINYNKNLKVEIFLFSSHMWEEKHTKQLQWTCQGGHINQTLRV